MINQYALPADNYQHQKTLAFNCFLEGNFQKSLTMLQHLHQQQPNDWEIVDKIGANLFHMGSFEQLAELTNQILFNNSKAPTTSQRKFFISLIYQEFIAGNFGKVKTILNKSTELFGNLSTEQLSNPVVIYLNYFKSLIDFYDRHSHYYHQKYDGIIHVIGESHCLSPAHFIVSYQNINYKFTPYPVLDIKIWNLISSNNNRAKASFYHLLSKIPKDALVMFCIGEIDCRIDDGIMKFYRNNPSINLNTHIEQMVDNYVNLIKNIAIEKNATPIIQGVPAVRTGILTCSLSEQKQLNDIVFTLNQLLRDKCLQQQIKFIDVYGLTVNDSGVSNDKYHIDWNHLKPSYVLEFFK